MARVKSSAISVDEALASYWAETRVLPVQEAALAAANGRTLASDARAMTDLPPFEQSAMDGYALRAADTARAAADRPATLQLAGEIPAGRVRDVAPLGPMQAVKVFTGSHMPPGSDAVLRQEDAAVCEGRLLVKRPCHAGEDYRHQGEELLKGTLLARSGTRVRFGSLASLAAAGVTKVSIRRAPRISAVVTGDEVTVDGSELERGQVPDANAPTIRAWLHSQGYLDVELIHVGDDFRRTVAALERAFERSDLVISTGGISFGEHDLVVRAAGAVGVSGIFRGVRQRPGKPLFFGVCGGKPFLGLPGNPGAMFVGLIIHARAILDAMEGASPRGPCFWHGRIARAVPMERNAERWLRCGVEISDTGEVVLTPQDRQASHMIANLAHCAALARIPAGTGNIAAQSVVSWTPVENAVLEYSDPNGVSTPQ
jgi:molybdopterin molybdotransferase